MWTNEVNAQSGLTPSEYNALVAAVETTAPTSASLAPPFGNFYTVTHGESWPPLPADTMGLDFWDLGGGYYLLDDTSHDYSAVHAEYSFGGLFPTNGGSGGSGESGPDFTPQTYSSSDLWLQIINTNNALSLVIHPPAGVTEGVYDVLYTTNLTQPISWQWLLRTDPGQTNLTVSIGTNAGTFYALGKPDDLVANDSLGTNFWLVFPSMEPHVTPVLSLYISSPVGATGTVTIQGQSNGPTLAVTGTNDNPALYGTYVLTNMYLDPTTYIGYSPFDLTGEPVSNVYVKGSYRIFFDESRYDDFGWVLADSTSNSVIYFGPYGADDLNDVDWGGIYTEGILEASCAEDTSVLPFAVTAGSAAIVPIPMEAMVSADNVVVTNSAINVSAQAPVSVYAVKYDAAASAAFTAYPTPLLGTNYNLLARPELAPPGAGPDQLFPICGGSCGGRYDGACYAVCKCLAQFSAGRRVVPDEPAAGAGFSSHQRHPDK